MDNKNEPEDEVLSYIEEIKSVIGKTKRHILMAKEKFITMLREMSARQKKLTRIAGIVFVIMLVIFGITLKVYRSSDTYAYNLAETYGMEERYEEAAKVYQGLIIKNDDLKAKEILAFIYLDKLDDPQAAEPLLRELVDLTESSRIRSRLEDVFPVVTVSPESNNEEIYRDLVAVELSTRAQEARLLYRIVSGDGVSEFRDYTEPIELGDGESVIEVKAISSAGYEGETLSHSFKVDLDDKFVAFESSTLESEIRKALGKTDTSRGLRQSDLAQVVSIQLVGGQVLVNQPVLEPVEEAQEGTIAFDGFGDLSSLTELETLVMAGSGLRELSFIESLTQLSYLDVSHNNLTQVDLSGFDLLIYFDGTANQMTAYPKTASINNLEVMILKDNPIEDLSELESALSGISYLDLSGTNITDVSIFGQANKLEILKLPEASQLLNLSVFDDVTTTKVVPINTLEIDLPSDLLNRYLTRFNVK